LGLATPGNLALLSSERRRGFWRTALAAVAIGAAAALLVLALDQVLFAGSSLQRVRTVGELSFAQRVLIVLFSGITEELVFRLGIATATAALAFLALRRVGSRAAQIAMWLGILVACLVFGLAHVGNLPDVPHPYLRAITLNGVAGLVLGWLYWFRGLEAAILAHLAADASIYLLVASLL
jgi:membrane protease YdiL (CAAX protease family)